MQQGVSVLNNANEVVMIYFSSVTDNMVSPHKIRFNCFTTESTLSLLDGNWKLLERKSFELRLSVLADH